MYIAFYSSSFRFILEVLLGIVERLCDGLPCRRLIRPLQARSGRNHGEYNLYGLDNKTILQNKNTNTSFEKCIAMVRSPVLSLAS